MLRVDAAGFSGCVGGIRLGFGLMQAEYETPTNRVDGIRPRFQSGAAESPGRSGRFRKTQIRKIQEEAILDNGKEPGL